MRGTEPRMWARSIGPDPVLAEASRTQAKIWDVGPHLDLARLPETARAARGERPEALLPPKTPEDRSRLWRTIALSILLHLLLVPAVYFGLPDWRKQRPEGEPIPVRMVFEPPAPI